MQVVSDPTVRQKIIAVKNEKRSFVVEFPADADLAELYGVVSNIKEELWKALEKQKEDEAPKVEPEVSAKIEELVTE